MPNGGTDNCGNCSHNPDGGWCRLRDVMIVDKMWTYCANATGHDAPNDEIRGPIFASGIYEGYVRIPWLSDRRPKSNRQVKCYECGDFVEDGIEVELRTGEKFGFCCNRNYFKWWSSRPEADEETKKKYARLEGLDGCPKDDNKSVNSFVQKDD